MKKRILIVAILFVLGAAAIALSWPRIDRWLEIDACLDRGGCWDYEAKQCVLEDQTRCAPRSAVS